LKPKLFVTAAALLLMGNSCSEFSGNKNRGPIILGDSSTIITEKDSQYLKDDVMDIEPQKKKREADTVLPIPVKDTTTAQKAKEPAAETRASQEAAGYALDFGEARMVIAGLDLRENKRQNPEQQNELTYALKSGNLSAGKLVFYGVKNVSVKQRYQSRLLLKSALGTVDLRDLGLYTSGWNNLNGSNSFVLNTLNNLSFVQVNNNKIRNAADRELRKRRTSSRTIQSWMKEIKKIRNADDKPCDVLLDNVQWQVTGTDAKGKPFRKTIRVDA
jgi:hypothetical protein